MVLLAPEASWKLAVYIEQPPTTNNGRIAPKNGLCTCLLQQERLEHYEKLFCVRISVILLWI